MHCGLRAMANLYFEKCIVDCVLWRVLYGLRCQVSQSVAGSQQVSGEGELRGERGNGRSQRNAWVRSASSSYERLGRHSIMENSAVVLFIS